MENKGYFISGIGTDVGKTVIAMLLAEYLELPYWKPIQTGNILDAETIQNKKPNTEIVPTLYSLEMPAAPLIADKDKIIDINLVISSKPSTPLIIEGAGGLMVPIHQDKLWCDIISVWQMPVILVARNYLGYINHTLLSLYYLKNKGIKVAAVILNESQNDTTEDYIQSLYPNILFFKIPTIESMESYSYNFEGL